jgi:hypothetical protein
VLPVRGWDCFFITSTALTRNTHQMPSESFRFKEKRGITAEEHQKILDGESNADLREYYKVLWHLGGSKIDRRTAWTRISERIRGLANGVYPNTFRRGLPIGNHNVLYDSKQLW